MREIKAIIQPFKLIKVIQALKEIEGLPGVTVSEVHGFGRARAADSSSAGVEDTVEYVKKSKVETVVPDRLVNVVVQTIYEKARTGNPGDGKIFVYEVDDVVRIRTGESGEAAI